MGAIGGGSDLPEHWIVSLGRHLEIPRATGYFCLNGGECFSGEIPISPLYFLQKQNELTT